MFPCTGFAHDPFRGISLEGAVLSAFGAERVLQHVVAFVALVRQHRVVAPRSSEFSSIVNGLS